MKSICSLYLLLFVFVSCKEQNKTNVNDPQEVHAKPGKPGNEATTVLTKQSFLNIPWVDPALIAAAKGC